MRQLRWALSGFLLLSVLLSASAWADEYTSEEQRLLEAYHSGELLRLHILADNDAPEAQQLKLAVRNAILTRFAAELNEATTADEAFARLCSLLPQMEALAADTVQRAGFDLPVSAEAGVLSLPEKRYGQVVLPEGDYRGLRITLGSGEGRNWWCILFPQLCLALADEEPWVSPAAEPSELPSPASSELQWDSLRVLRAACGREVVVARRKGDKWYVGGITNDRPYTTEIALDFLPAGRTFTMTSFEDGVNADLQATDYRKRVREVDASTVVKVEMVRNGGWAAVIE